MGDDAIGLEEGCSRCPDAAIGLHKCSGEADPIALDLGAARLLLQVDRRDAKVFKREEFVCRTAAVAVEVTPDLELRKPIVGCVNCVVLVRVELRERGETVNGLISEEFLDAIDDSIVVSIGDQETIIGGRPAGLFGKTIAIEVEMGSRLRNVPQLNAVSI